MPHGPTTAGNGPGEPQPKRRRPIGRAVALVVLMPVLLLTLIAGYTLAGTIIDSRYDSHEDRSPIGRIVIAAVAFAATLGALEATRRAQHATLESHPDDSRWFISIVLIGLAVVLILFSWIFISITGPL
jgi:predicted benzoate:H+ symporter BenE